MVFGVTQRVNRWTAFLLHSSFSKVVVNVQFGSMEGYERVF